MVTGDNFQDKLEENRVQNCVDSVCSFVSTKR